MLNLSKHHFQRQDYAELVQQLVGKHALKIWSLMCLFVLLTGALATVGLLDAGYDPTDARFDPSAPRFDNRTFPFRFVKQPQER